MDMVLCRLDMDAMELCYAAANNSFYIIHANGVLDEYNPDKMPVGYHPEQKPFAQRTVKLHPGDMIYCFTDGFADQFGGAQGKKFKYRRFQELLLSVSSKTTDVQDATLDKAFNEWKGSNAQTDDVLVIGIRI
jgi:serine phosphatase RsbU (regulator of sigma subunit)